MELKEIEHLAELSKLKFTEDELKEFSFDFENLVKLADVVKNAKVVGNKKINSLKLTELRDDEAKESFSNDLILLNSPEVRKDSFVVPKIME